MKHRSGPDLPTHISLALAGLMWVLPFLVPHHAYPLTTFYQEWMAGLFGLLAALSLLRAQVWESPVLPVIVVLPLGLVLLVMLHEAGGRIVYAGQAMMLGGYFVWVALLMVLGRWLAESFGLLRLALFLAGCLVVGGELSALAGLIQHYHWPIFPSWVTAKVSHAVYGNLAQPNHYADYLALALVSLGLLRHERHWPAWSVALLAMPLLFVMVLSGSRSAWLYLVALVAGFAIVARRHGELAGLRNYCAVLLPTFLLMHGVLQLPWFDVGDDISTLDRLLDDAGSGGLHRYLWHESLLIFLQHPWLGAGFGQFAWQHFQFGPVLKNPQVTGLYNNAHDLPLHFSAETGLLGVALLLVPLWFWVRRVWAQSLSASHAWGLGLLLVLGIHSLLEYPLWYSYFLGIAALLLGALDPSGHRLRLPLLGRLASGSLLLAGAVGLLPMRADYQRLEALVAQRVDDGKHWQTQYQGLHELTGKPLLRPWAELYMNPMVQATHASLSLRRAWNERALHFVPSGQSSWRAALLLGEAGQPEEARIAIERAIWAYPQDYAWFMRELEREARKDPERWSGLLKFAVQKYEEYQGAVHYR